MESFLLEGAPDGSIGTQEEKTSAVQVMHLELNNDILDDLLECIRKGKAPQVLFGKTAVCSRGLDAADPPGCGCLHTLNIED
jgi:hypothetical protein